MAQIGSDVIVPFEMAQIPGVLFATGWTNHQIILNRCKTDTERLFESDFDKYLGELPFDEEGAEQEHLKLLLSAKRKTYHPNSL